MQARITNCIRRSISSAAPTGVLSTTYRGTFFEERSMKILQDHLSMSLRHVGGKSDGGIDLMGWWWLPPPSSGPGDAPIDPSLSRRRLRVLAQCKAEKRKASPKYVREMEGVLHRYISLLNPSPALGAASTSQYPLVALLVSESPFTKATILRAQSSPVPFFLLHIPPLPDPNAAATANEESDSDEEPNENKIGSAVWNPALVRGLLDGKMEVRWERSPNGTGRPGLWWGGRRLQSWTPDNASEADLTLDREDSFFEALAEGEPSG
ncbi:hypothetical protein DFH08DRAFT_287839 [Mycena albidolilacea]|uniref:Required for respiratory growth protein 7, mitochondrial n=1 Tax=Mycena albidolilacea TaxID=1033008 RepID=A0AAD7EL42_9AGAR|nr:hypothetical protein DFH08DRAFT_287839 [Mycena albidolilacea]